MQKCSQKTSFQKGQSFKIKYLFLDALIFFFKTIYNQ